MYICINVGIYVRLHVYMYVRLPYILLNKLICMPVCGCVCIFYVCMSVGMHVP